MDSGVTTRQALVSALEQLQAIRDQVADIEDTVRGIVWALKVCPHPIDYRQDITTFGDFGTYLCRLCNEVRSGR